MKIRFDLWILIFWRIKRFLEPILPTRKTKWLLFSEKLWKSDSIYFNPRRRSQNCFKEFQKWVIPRLNFESFLIPHFLNFYLNFYLNSSLNDEDHEFRDFSVNLKKPINHPQCEFFSEENQFREKMRKTWFSDSVTFWKSP